jgi:hypothetical protein
MRTTKIISQLKKAIKSEHLYSSEELQYMKEQLSFMEEKIKELSHKDYRGFGKK